MGVVYLGGAHRLYDEDLDVQRDTLAWAMTQKRGDRLTRTVAPVTGVEAVRLWNEANTKKKPKGGDTEIDAFLAMEDE